MNYDVDTYWILLSLEMLIWKNFVYDVHQPAVYQLQQRVLVWIHQQPTKECPILLSWYVCDEVKPCLQKMGWYWKEGRLVVTDFFVDDNVEDHVDDFLDIGDIVHDDAVIFAVMKLIRTLQKKAYGAFSSVLLETH